MPTREQLMREIGEVPDHLLEELLAFLRAVRQRDDEARAATVAAKPHPVGADRPDAPTWSDVALADLVAQQGVSVCGDPAALVGQWPPEDSVDELLALVREVRQ